MHHQRLLIFSRRRAENPFAHLVRLIGLGPLRVERQRVDKAKYGIGREPVDDLFDPAFGFFRNPAVDLFNRRDVKRLRIERRRIELAAVSKEILAEFRCIRFMEPERIRDRERAERFVIAHEPREQRVERGEIFRTCKERFHLAARFAARAVRRHRKRERNGKRRIKEIFIRGFFEPFFEQLERKALLRREGGLPLRFAYLRNRLGRGSFRNALFRSA